MTKLLYMDDMCCLRAEARVIDVINAEDQSTVILDQTVFYPQGGGQPSDKGTIQHDNAIFNVQNVAMHDGTVHHKGEFVQGAPFAPGDMVNLSVDANLRMLHNRNHTAGHLIDYALELLGHHVVASKAYHFPQGPYVEYQGTMEQPEREQLQIKLEPVLDDLVKQALPVSIKCIDNDCKKRAMCVANYAPILCGGTHVVDTSEVGHITIRKIKNEKGNLRVSYAVD